MRFRKRPIEVDAEQFAPNRPFPPGVCMVCPADVRTPHVHTGRGPINIHPGDWVVCGVRGEFYPVIADVFAATFERVEP